MLIALPDDNVPQVLFLEIDDDPRSRAVLADQIRTFVRGAGSWLIIARGELQTPGLPPETDLVSCSAHEGDDEQTVLLRVARDEEGRIYDLVEVLPLVIPWLGLPAHSC